MDFFREAYPGYLTVFNDRRMIGVSGQGGAATPESARASIEHGLRVCRDGGFEVRQAEDFCCGGDIVAIVFTRVFPLTLIRRDRLSASLGTRNAEFGAGNTMWCCVVWHLQKPW